MKLIISFCTYPRPDGTTFNNLKNTVSSLLSSVPPEITDIRILIIGDDYSNIKELDIIFSNYGYEYEFYNININNALRNTNVSHNLKWKHAVTRTIIKAFEYGLETDYDYLLLSSDDDTYDKMLLKNIVIYSKKYNYPDFIFSQGRLRKKKIIPSKINPDLTKNYPHPNKTIEAGTVYKLTNKNFIKDIIQFRYSRWSVVKNVIENKPITEKIKPEDYELWEYLLPKFNKNIYTSVLIPKLLVYHDIEGTLKTYLKAQKKEKDGVKK